LVRRSIASSKDELARGQSESQVAVDGPAVQDLDVLPVECSLAAGQVVLGGIAVSHLLNIRDPLSQGQGKLAVDQVNQAEPAHKRADGKYDVTLTVDTHKFRPIPRATRPKSRSTAGLRSALSPRLRRVANRGALLYRDRIHMTKAHGTYTFTVNELLDKAGVDPFNLLIDRVPDDNVKSVTLSGAKLASAK
jgi:hypothetical protein